MNEKSLAEMMSRTVEKFPDKDGPLARGKFSENVPSCATRGRVAPLPQSADFAPGLDHFNALDKIIVSQYINVAETVFGVHMPNRYAILNGSESKCYYAYEESKRWQRIFCRSRRGFNMHIVNGAYQEVLKLERKFK